MPRHPAWLQAGGHWLGLHGTSGGRAERVEGMRQRRTVKAEHHALLGSYFLTHPPICKIRVDVSDMDHPLTRGLGASFNVEDEPYFIELQDPASTRILLTADYGPGAVSPSIGTLYPSDTSLQSDGRTRVLGYTRPVGDGGVTYFALGHCHNPAISATRTAAANETTPATFRGAWDSDAFIGVATQCHRLGRGRDTLTHASPTDTSPAGSSPATYGRPGCCRSPALVPAGGSCGRSRR